MPTESDSESDSVFEDSNVSWFAFLIATFCIFTHEIIFQIRSKNSSIEKDDSSIVKVLETAGVTRTKLRSVTESHSLLV